MESNSNVKHLNPSRITKFTIIRLGLLCTLLIIIVSNYIVTYHTRNKNERAIESVLTSLLTCPDIELLQLLELCTLKVGPGFIEEPKPEDVVRFDNKINDMFGSYLTEKSLDYIKTSGLRYHLIADIKGYQMTVENIEINQDQKDPLNYTFAIHLSYTSSNVENKKLIVNGRAQCLEEGKITFIRFSDNFFLNEFIELRLDKYMPNIMGYCLETCNSCTKKEYLLITIDTLFILLNYNSYSCGTCHLIFRIALNYFAKPLVVCTNF